MSLSRGPIRDVVDADAKLKYATPIIENIYIKEDAPDWLVTSILDDLFGFKIRYVIRYFTFSGKSHKCRIFDSAITIRRIILLDH
jgi:hypothetical protein